MCFCEKAFTRILLFLIVYAWANFRQTIAWKLSELSEKTTTIDYFSDNVKFLGKLSIGAIFITIGPMNFPIVLRFSLILLISLLEPHQTGPI